MSEFTWRINVCVCVCLCVCVCVCDCRSYGVSELEWRINVVGRMLNMQVAVALVFSVLVVLLLWRRELTALLRRGARALIEP